MLATIKGTLFNYFSGVFWSRIVTHEYGGVADFLPRPQPAIHGAAHKPHAAGALPAGAGGQFCQLGGLAPRLHQLEPGHLSAAGQRNSAAPGASCRGAREGSQSQPAAPARAKAAPGRETPASGQ